MRAFLRKQYHHFLLIAADIIKKIHGYTLIWSRPSKKILTRSQYKEVWNSLSKSEDDAKLAVSANTDENINRQTAEGTVALLRHCVGIRKEDLVLEIGAGFGRVGAALAPLCREWIGTDVSENMVGHIRRRLAEHPNVRAIATNGFDLAGIPTESVDMVYCTVVFPHLDEWERYGYIAEGFRVLKPGGRMLVDNVNLISDPGWKFFEDHRCIPVNERLPHMSKTSTPQELETYFRRAGFCDIRQEQPDPWIVTYGRKPSGSAMP